MKIKTTTKSELEKLEKLLFKFKGFVEFDHEKQFNVEHTLEHVYDELAELKNLKDDKIRADHD